MASVSIRDMLSNLAESGVNTNMVRERATSYTPRKIVTVHYCGTLNDSPDILDDNSSHIIQDGEAQVLQSVNVKFVRGNDKIKTVRKKFPGIVFEDDATLVFYKKGSSGTYRKLWNLDGDLQELVKRTDRSGGDAVMYAFKYDQNYEPPVQNRNVDHAELDPENHPHLLADQENIPHLLADRENHQDLHADRDHPDLHADRDHPDLHADREDHQDLQNRRIDDVRLNMNRSPLRNVVDLEYRNGSLDLNEDQFSHISHSHYHGWQEFAGSSRPGPESIGLPDPQDIFRWEECTETPVGKELKLEEVSESDFSSVSKFVEEVKLRPKIFDEEMDVDATTPSVEMSSKLSVLELLEKGSELTQDFKDFISDSKMSTELLTFLCLLATTDAEETTHLVTPKEVQNIQNNVPPYGPDQNVKNIIILNSDNEMSFIALVKRDNDSGDNYLNRILAIDNSKYYVSKLLIRDVCDNLCLDVNYSETVCDNLVKFNSEDGELMTNLSLFFSARNLLGLNPPVPLTELVGLVEIANNRVKEFKQTSKLESNIDWYTSYENSLKRNREDDQ